MAHGKELVIRKEEIGKPNDPGASPAGSFVTGGARADVAVVIVTYNSEKFITQLLDDLRAVTGGLRLRVIVVDNDSRDRTAQQVSQCPDVTLVSTGANLGFGGGLNTGFRCAAEGEAILLLNPDLRVDANAVIELFAALQQDGVGAAVPLMREADGKLFLSLRREPSLLRALGDALFGNKLGTRPGWSAETELSADRYTYAHDVDWATGAAMLVPYEVWREVGDWWDEYPIYSEETDFCRRIRATGRQIRFVPSAVVTHHGGGSGSSHGLAGLLAVNRIRYILRYHSRAYARAFRAAVVLGAALRAYQPASRYCLGVLVRSSRWDELPAITRQR